MTASRVDPRTSAVRLRRWHPDDAPAALRVYGGSAAHQVRDVVDMRARLVRWNADQHSPYLGHWALLRRGESTPVGGAALLPLPPGDEDLGITWQFGHDGDGGAHGDLDDRDDLAAECVHALADWAFAHGADEVFAVVADGVAEPPAVRRNGMSWVGETTKYFGRKTQVYRLRVADLDPGAADSVRV
ncbi:GNAT family N-acetyltransferase [Actinokineospora inagensis]|uniref:GNAT family N-acetyltransferase n=1 Tax=Actinokineospora inagensis TaxID=103730 RepID=UPI000404DFEF|nr:hypothetical protein [Actinokineospora inagensis]